MQGSSPPLLGPCSCPVAACSGGLGTEMGQPQGLHCPFTSPGAAPPLGLWGKLGGQVPRLEGKSQSQWTPQPAEDSSLRCPWSASPQLLQRKAQGQERHSEGRDRANIPQMAGGIYSFSNYFILRPKCGLTGLKREELALCRRVGGNRANICNGILWRERAVLLAKLKRKRPHYFEIMSIIA